MKDARRQNQKNNSILIQDELGQWSIPAELYQDMIKKVYFEAGKLTKDQARNNPDIESLWKAEERYARLYLIYHLMPFKDQTKEGENGLESLQMAKADITQQYIKTGVVAGVRTSGRIVANLETDLLKWARSKNDTAAKNLPNPKGGFRQ